MKKRILLILLSLLSPLYCYNIDYQIHSNNDLNELSSLLIKGARWFKFDPHYVKYHKLCNKKAPCLLLNHDNPSVLYSSYNTSDELLTYLSTSIILSSITNRNNEKITIQLCFKSAPDKCNFNSDDFIEWLGLVKDFYNKTINLNFNNIEFILDGDGKPIDCLVGQFPLFSSVWISTDSPSEAFYSNDVTSDYNRFQILNDPDNQQNWTWKSSINYGKFSSINRPYQLWEPDSQQAIQDYIKIYKEGLQHDAGFHFAINQDVAMFRVYSNTNDNYTSPGVNQLLLSTSSSPIISTITLARNDVILTFISEKNLCYSLSSISNDRVIIRTGATFPISSISNNENYFIKAITVSLTNDKNLNIFNSTTLLLLSNSCYYVIDMEINRNSLTSNVNRLIPGNFSESNIYDLKKYDCETGVCIYVLSYDTEITGFILSSYRVSLIDGTNILQSKAVILCKNSKSIDDASILIINNAPKMIFYSTDNQIYGSIIKENYIDWKYLTVGKNFDIGITYKDDAIMLINDYGYCYNSHDHNTRSYPTVCSSIPIASSFVLDYSIGLTTDWIKLLESSLLSSSQPLITSCNAKVLHGSFNQGKKPSIIITNIDDRNMFFSLHEALNDSDNDNNGCGDPVRYNESSVLIDSFDIQSWIDTLKEIYND